MPARQSPLFRTRAIREVLEERRLAALQEVDRVAVESLASDRIEGIVAGITQRYRLEPIELTEGAISVEAEEAQVDVAGSWERNLEHHRGPYYVSGTRVTFHIPFKGDRALFDLHPSTFTTTYPHGVVRPNEVEMAFERADNDVVAAKRSFDQELARLRAYVGYVNADIHPFNASLGAVLGERAQTRASHNAQRSAGLESLGIAVRRRLTAQADAVLVPSPERERTPEPAAEVYDVALSFAGEDRDYVEQVATTLRDLGVRVFYDMYERAELWGRNLVDHLGAIYQNRSRFVVMFISAHYVRKVWTTHERQHAQARQLLAQEEYILPARFDDTEVPGLTNTVGHIDLRRVSPSELAQLILEKVRRAK